MRDQLLAVLGSLALAVLITWPAAIDLSGGMVGHPGNDTWNHAWGFWWVQDGIATDGAVPLHTDLLNHPLGGTLFFIDSFNALWTVPAGWIGVPAAFNLAVLVAFTFNGFGMWTLARYVLRDRWAAWVPAAVYASSAHLMGQAYNGISETLNAGWLPLTCWALLRLMDRQRPGRALALGALLGICSLSNFYYGLFGILVCVIGALHRAITEPRLTRWAPFVGFSALGAALYAVLVLPVLRILSASLGAEDAMVNRDQDFVWQSLLNHNITDAIGFFRPGRVYSPDLKALYGEDLIIVTYLGWVALTLALVAFARARPFRQLSLWGVFAVVFLVFSLGPYLHVNGAYVTWEGDWVDAEVFAINPKSYKVIPLPFLTFFEAFPLFSRISHPFRFVVPALLGIGLLAGFGVQWLKQRVHVAVVPVAVVAVLSEVLLGSPAPWPLPRCEAEIPAVYANLEGSEGAVLDLPITVPNLERAVYTWYQTGHGLPSPYGLNDPIPNALERNPLTALLVQVEASRAVTLPRMLPELELVIGRRLLEAQGYRWIVVHERLYPEHKRRMVRDILEPLLGEPEREGGVAVYALGPPA